MHTQNRFEAHQNNQLGLPLVTALEVIFTFYTVSIFSVSYNNHALLLKLEEINLGKWKLMQCQLI